MFGFGKAIDAMKDGFRVQRVGWNGPGQFLELQAPTASSKMTLPYIYICTVQGYLVPWFASQADMLSDDWKVIP